MIYLSDGSYQRECGHKGTEKWITCDECYEALTGKRPDGVDKSSLERFANMNHEERNREIARLENQMSEILAERRRIAKERKKIKVPVLYRHFDDDMNLLYVGITMNPTARWTQHIDFSKWWSQVRITTYEHFSSREELLEAERKAIERESPRCNIAFNTPASLW